MWIALVSLYLKGDIYINTAQSIFFQEDFFLIW